jgi:hypothetical protein
MFLKVFILLQFIKKFGIAPALALSQMSTKCKVLAYLVQSRPNVKPVKFFLLCLTKHGRFEHSYMYAVGASHDTLYSNIQIGLLF